MSWNLEQIREEVKFHILITRLRKAGFIIYI
jgi:hypothetical protein